MKMKTTASHSRFFRLLCILSLVAISSSWMMTPPRQHSYACRQRWRARTTKLTTPPPRFENRFPTTQQLLPSAYHTRSTRTSRYDAAVAGEVASAAISATTSSSSWRQYVPLAVSTLVIVDILLGSPIANRFATVLRQPPPSDDDDQDKRSASPSSRWNLLGSTTESSSSSSSSKERIDSVQVAKAAIDKAQNTLELRRYLDSRKTDQDRIEEVKRKLDAQYKDVDDSLKLL